MNVKIAECLLNENLKTFENYPFLIITISNLISITIYAGKFNL